MRPSYLLECAKAEYGSFALPGFVSLELFQKPADLSLSGIQTIGGHIIGRRVQIKATILPFGASARQIPASFAEKK